jgi:hypothetical protein
MELKRREFENLDQKDKTIMRPETLTVLLKEHSDVLIRQFKAKVCIILTQISDYLTALVELNPGAAAMQLMKPKFTIVNNENIRCFLLFILGLSV